MLRPKLILVLLSGLLALAWVTESQAYPITFTSIAYHAAIAAQDQEGVPGGTIFDYRAATPSFRTSITVGAASAWAEGEVGGDAPLASSLFAGFHNGFSYGSGSNLWAEFEFTATCPQISLSYAYKSERDIPGHGVGAVQFHLTDNANTVLYNGDHYWNSEGVVENVRIDLIPRHTYTIIAHLGAYNFDGPPGTFPDVRGSASASLTDIDIQALPLPPSLLFFGSGLLGLWAWGRRTPR